MTIIAKFPAIMGSIWYKWFLFINVYLNFLFDIFSFTKFICHTKYTKPNFDSFRQTHSPWIITTKPNLGLLLQNQTLTDHYKTLTYHYQTKPWLITAKPNLDFSLLNQTLTYHYQTKPWLITIKPNLDLLLPNQILTYHY